MDRAREREWARLEAAAGLANDRSPAAIEAGRRVEELAREGLEMPLRDHAPETAQDTATDDTPGDPRPSESFVDRIKAVLAA